MSAVARLDDEAAPEAVESAIKDAGGDREAAVNLLMSRADLRPSLQRALIDYYRPDLLRDICWEAVAQAQRVNRTSAKKEARLIATARPSPDHSSTDDPELLQWTNSALTRLRTWSLPDGTALPRASGSQIRAAAKLHRGHEASHRSSALFYESVALHVGPTQIVEEVLTSQKLLDLLEESER